MSNQVQIYSNPEFGSIRTLEIDGEIWFVGKDVCDALGYQKARNTIANHVEEKDALKRGVTDSLGRNQETTLVNEPGLYALVMGSKLPSARRFQHWVTHDVLPSIRKTGSYSIEQNPVQATFDSEVRAVQSAGNLSNVLTQSFGVEPNIARAVAIHVLEERCGLDLDYIKKILPPAEKVEMLLTPTEIGQRFNPNISGRKVNHYLEECGFQIYRGKGKWEITESGKEFAVCIPFTGKHSKHSDFQIKWKSEILDVLQKFPFIF